VVVSGIINKYNDTMIFSFFLLKVFWFFKSTTTGKRHKGQCHFTFFCFFFFSFFFLSLFSACWVTLLSFFAGKHGFFFYFLSPINIFFLFFFCFFLFSIAGEDTVSFFFSLAKPCMEDDSFFFFLFLCFNCTRNFF